MYSHVHKTYHYNTIRVMQEAEDERKEEKRRKKKKKTKNRFFCNNKQYTPYAVVHCTCTCYVFIYVCVYTYNCNPEFRNYESHNLMWYFLLYAYIFRIEYKFYTWQKKLRIFYSTKMIKDYSPILVAFYSQFTKNRFSFSLRK